MDFNILYALNSIHTEVLDRIMIVLTYFGEKGIFWIALSVILMFNKKTRKCGIFMMISMALGLIIGNGILKNLIARERPCWIDTSIQLLIANPKDFSFPSGHTLASFEAAVMIFLFNKKLGIPALVLATLVGISRLYLFVHFPTDVLGGAILGTVISLCVYFGVNKILKDRHEKNSVAVETVTEGEKSEVKI